MRRLLTILGILLAGIVIGGWLFSRSIPRSFLAVHNCKSTCFRPSEMVGLLASVGIQKASGVIPLAVMESDTCIAMQHPKPEARVHLLLIPKRDIKNIGEITEADQEFVMGCFALVSSLATKNNAQNYRLLSNGPALQHVTYLHFHFMAN